MGYHQEVSDGVGVPLAGAAAAGAVAAGLLLRWKGWPITPTSVVPYTPPWRGRKEHSIHIAPVVSVGIDTKMYFSDLVIETSGGMKQLIEQHQTQDYQAPVDPAQARPGGTARPSEVARG